MRKIGLYLNVLHYCFYKAHYKLHLFAQKVNPFNLIHRLPFQKRRYEQLGIDIHEEINKAFGNKKYGLSMLVAGGVLLALVFSGILSILKLVSNTLSISIFLISVVLSIYICYLFVFKNDQYITYFDKFENCPKHEKRKYTFATLSFVILIFLLFIYVIM